MKTIVVSGVNLFSGGPLKVMQDCLSALSGFVSYDCRIIALVHRKDLYPTYPNVEYREFPKSRKSWLFRLYYEYIGFRKLSKVLNPDCWFSLHDTTPNVQAKKRIVYCHNPFPFYHPGLREFRLQPGIFMITIFSKYIYKINIHKNNHVIVQQQWIRDAFQKIFSINNIIVSIPVHENNISRALEGTNKENDNSITRFFYPSRAMIHKNFEVICKAVALLESEGFNNFEVAITVIPDENNYAKYLYEKYGRLKNLHFVGYLNRQEMNISYNNCDCVIFPSKVETWGLPITEAQEYHKPILISDLPYAWETVGKYEKVKFFNPDKELELANLIKKFASKELVFDKTNDIKYAKPYARNWVELFHLIFEEYISN